jgi:hypothetical protein
MRRRFFGRALRTIDYLLGLRMSEHEQFFPVEPQRLAQPIDQRNRWPAASVLDVRDVACPDADRCEIALGHARPVTSFLYNSAKRSFGHFETFPDAIVVGLDLILVRERFVNGTYQVATYRSSCRNVGRSEWQPPSLDLIRFRRGSKSYATHQAAPWRL